jgi:hypothetical protein
MVNCDEDLYFAIVNSSACCIASHERAFYYLTRLVKGHKMQPSALGVTEPQCFSTPTELGLLNRIYRRTS